MSQSRKMKVTKTTRKFIPQTIKCIEIPSCSWYISLWWYLYRSSEYIFYICFPKCVVYIASGLFIYFIWCCCCCRLYIYFRIQFDMMCICQFSFQFEVFFSSSVCCMFVLGVFLLQWWWWSLWLIERKANILKYNTMSVNIFLLFNYLYFSIFCPSYTFVAFSD